MFPVLIRFIQDEVGSTVGSEFALVTGVTVGALLVGAGNFSATITRNFETVSKAPALQMSTLEKEQQEEENRKRAEFEQRKAAAERRKNL